MSWLEMQESQRLDGQWDVSAILYLPGTARVGDGREEDVGVFPDIYAAEKAASAYAERVCYEEDHRPLAVASRSGRRRPGRVATISTDVPIARSYVISVGDVDSFQLQAATAGRHPRRGETDALLAEARLHDPWSPCRAARGWPG